MTLTQENRSVLSPIILFATEILSAQLINFQLILHNGLRHVLVQTLRLLWSTRPHSCSSVLTHLVKLSRVKQNWLVKAEIQTGSHLDAFLVTSTNLCTLSPSEDNFCSDS